MFVSFFFQTNKMAPTNSNPPYNGIVTVETYSSHLALRDIPVGTVLASIYGNTIKTPSRYTVQNGEASHVDVEPPMRYTNHSCNPNAMFTFDKEPWQLVSNRPIAAGEEITFNYASTEYKMAEAFTCTCGSEKCLEKVQGYFYLPDERKKNIEGNISPTIRVLRDRKMSCIENVVAK
jgi:hypothetical protein